MDRRQSGLIRTRHSPRPRFAKALQRGWDQQFESRFLQQRVACEPGAYSNKDFVEGFASKFRPLTSSIAAARRWMRAKLLDIGGPRSNGGDEPGVGPIPDAAPRIATRQAAIDAWPICR